MKKIFTSKLDLNFGTKLVKCYTCNIAVCGAEAWILWKVDQKYIVSFKWGV
jgi:hypothetical protein